MSKRAKDAKDKKRGAGRPNKGEGPLIPYEELDRLLVFGEVVKLEGAQKSTVVFPSYRELARRFGISHSIIATYARSHNCQQRRKQNKMRVAAKADQKMVEIRANAIAVSRDDGVMMIDSFLLGFQQALAEGRVRFDNPADFNTMMRLKEFILGGADSRQEIHAALSLEDIQSRHKKMLRAEQDTSNAERGLADPPALPSSTTISKTTGQILVNIEKAPVSPHEPTCGQGALEATPGRGDRQSAPHEPDGAPTLANDESTEAWDE